MVTIREPGRGQSEPLCARAQPADISGGFATGAAKHKVVFILSLNYSGSHFLSLLLGSHSRAVHVGETKRLRKPVREGSKTPCHLCGTNECKLFRGLQPDRLEDLYPTIFANCGPGIEVAVDASKKPRWAVRYLDDDRFEKHFIHLIRDPRATIRRGTLRRTRVVKRMRWARRHPSLAPQLLFSRPRRYHFYKWLAENRDITRFLRENDLDHTIVTYHDLAMDPARQLAPICAKLGLEFEEEQIEYWNFEHHGSQKVEYEWVKSAKTRLIDLRWREFLDEDEQLWVREHPLGIEYLSELGLELTDSGLTRPGAGGLAVDQGTSAPRPAVL